MSDLELKINIPKIPEINWSEERHRLAIAVKNRLEKYKGVVYTDDTITQAKADRATLNRFAKALDDRRKEIKSVYEEPIKKFSAEVNEIIKSIADINANIDAQIKSYEEKKKAEKQNAINEIYAEIIGNLKDFVSLERIADPRWLNMTYPLSAVKADLAKKIEQINNELKTINALKSEDDATLKAYYFRTLSLADALVENERLKEIRNKINAVKVAKHEQIDKAEDILIEQAQVIENEESKTTEVTYTISFEITATSNQLKDLKEFFIANKIQYRKI